MDGELGIKGRVGADDGDAAAVTGVFQAVFEDILQRFCQPLLVGGEQGIRREIGLYGDVMQLERKGQRTQGRVQQFCEGHGRTLEDDHAGVQLRKLEQGGEQPIHTHQEFLCFADIGAALAFVGAVGDEGKEDIDGGERRAQLVGDIGQAVGQMDLVFFEGGVLLADAQGHFGDLALQNGELAFVHFIDGQAVDVVQHQIDLMGEIGEVGVAGAGEEQKGHAKNGGGNHA